MPIERIAGIYNSRRTFGEKGGEQWRHLRKNLESISHSSERETYIVTWALEAQDNSQWHICTRKCVRVTHSRGLRPALNESSLGNSENIAFPLVNKSINDMAQQMVVLPYMGKLKLSITFF
jgi:hypothetical protein